MFRRPGQLKGVVDLLSEYGDEDWHKEPDRVHRAILRLSEGDLEELKHLLAAAKTDYRDVLWWSGEPPDKTN